MTQAAVAAWSGLANGRIPVAMMSPIGNGQVMEPHAARQLLAAIADMNAHGFAAPIVEGYRDYATQVQLRNLYLAGKGNVAAVPGTSNHGTGSAVDLGDGMDSWSSSAQAYWGSIESRYGFSSAQGRADGEPWHKVCVMWLDNISSTITARKAVDEETEMYYKANGGSSNGQIGNGWTYKQLGNGPVVPLTNLESVALAASGAFVASYSGDDILLLAAVYGLTEYQVLPAGNKIWAGQELQGPGKLTGRIIYPGSPLREYPVVQVASA